MISGEVCKLYSTGSVPLGGTFYYTTLSLSIKVQKRIGIARQKWTKINVHFSKGAWDFVQMGSLKNTL